MEQDPHYQTLAMPRFWRKYAVIWAVIVLVAIGLAFERDDSFWWNLLPLLVAVTGVSIFRLRMKRFIHCPRCSRTMMFREVNAFTPVKGNKEVAYSFHAHGPGTKKVLYDCHACQITWDPQFVEDSTT